jgi:sulfite reductase beta subunit-like hemoprotein
LSSRPDIRGILEQRQKGFFVLRLKIPYGQVNSDQLPKIARISKKYGREASFYHAAGSKESLDRVS